MTYSLEQLVEMPHLFSRPKSITCSPFSLQELSERSKVLRDKKLTDASELRISDHEAMQYSDLAQSVEDIVSKISLKYGKCNTIPKPPSKGQ